MKRNVLVLFTLASLYLPIQVFATEGTCSYHGGVSCSSGSDWDGSAICNDGWRDSSEKFYDTKKCTQDLHYCTTEEYSKINSKYDLDGQRKILSELSSKIQTINSSTQDTSGQNITASAVLRNNSDTTRNNFIEVNKIYQQWSPLNVKYNNDFNTARQECLALGDKTYYNTLAENIRNRSEALYGTQNQTQQAIVPTIIVGGYIRGSELFCDNGYNKDIVNLKCVKDNLIAICSQGTNSQGGVMSTCNCTTGYKWVGGISCKKYNIQTGEFIEEAPVIVQSVTTSTSSIKNINQVIFKRTLKKGMSGDDVKQLQILLQKLNYLPSTHTPSTSFGPVTNLALIKFQKDNKILPATGTFGPSTQAKLLSLTK